MVLGGGRKKKACEEGQGGARTIQWRGEKGPYEGFMSKEDGVRACHRNKGAASS